MRGRGRRSLFCRLCQLCHDRLTLGRVDLIQLTSQHLGNLYGSFLMGLCNGRIQKLTVRSCITGGKSSIEILSVNEKEMTLSGNHV